MNNADDELKQESSRYELRDGILYSSELNTPVIIALDDLVATIESVHKDLGHYGKRTTLDAVTNSRTTPAAKPSQRIMPTARETRPARAR